MKRLSAPALVVVAIMMSGCGYALAGRGSFLPADIRIVGIPLLENRTPIQRIDQVITEKVRTEFIDRGKYEIVYGTGGVHAVLSGAILSFVSQPVGLDQQLASASRYRFTVTMRVQFTDSRSGEVLWSNEALTFSEEYDVRTRSGTQLEATVLIEQEGPAVDRLAADLARQVVSSILEAF